MVTPPGKVPWKMILYTPFMPAAGILVEELPPPVSIELLKLFCEIVVVPLRFDIHSAVNMSPGGPGVGTMPTCAT